MNNEPVAWAYIKDDGFFDAIHPDEHDKYEGMYKTPLYTHPTKDNYRETHEGFSTVIDATHPAKTYEDAIEECAQRAEAYAYMSPNFTALAEELRAILRKVQE